MSIISRLQGKPSSRPRFQPKLPFWFRTAQAKTQDDAASAIYERLVAAARASWLYAETGVPDTLTGRFDSLVFHVFLYMQALRLVPGDSEETVQALFDRMFIDMDRTLREIGVGDLSVGKKIKSMIEGYYGRLAAYTEVFATGNSEAIDAVLARNLYGGGSPDPASLARIRGYAAQSVKGLAAQTGDSLRRGAFTWPQ